MKDNTKPGRRGGWALRAALCCFVALVLGWHAGCSGGDKTYHVSGTVTCNGQPVPAGEIRFDPDVTKGNDGPQGFAFIKDGAYDTKDTGKPVAGGPHVVHIVGFDGKETGELKFGKPLFEAYEEKVDLPKATTTKDFNVPAKKK